ncbi:MAG: DUF362 domain-containing protein [Oscillospiraceae bacterium]|nr:DUF362 domain-containing protein [Oscillospiraceae bacterium]
MSRSSVPAIVPCESYEPRQLREALTAALDTVGGLDWVKSGMRIGIKINLCAARRPEQAATTHPAAAAELTRLLTERGAQVVLGDSPGEPFTPMVLNYIYALGGYRLCEEAGGELNRNFATHPVTLPEARTLKSVSVCDWVTDCDAVINFCKLKSHGLMNMTAGVKNLFGIIPGTMKSELHFRYRDPYAFSDLMVDLNEYLRPVLTLVDAVDIMEGNGPTKGTPRHLGALIAGRDVYAVDRLCARLLGVGEEEIPYLTAARERGLMPPEDAPLSLGEFESFCLRDFQRSGATSSWFLITDEDSLPQRLTKKVMAAALRSRPALFEGCTGCGACARLCPAKAITIKNKKAVIDRKKCVRCFCCQEFCPSGAMRVRRSVIGRILSR